MKKAFLINFGVFMSMCLAQGTSEQQQQVNTGQGGQFYQIDARYEPEISTLFYDKLDSQGRIIESIQEFFPYPPIQQCNERIPYSQLLQELVNQDIQQIVRRPMGLLPDSLVMCCDYYVPRLGYQFTWCDQGAGLFILNNRKGTQEDQFYINQNISAWAPLNINYTNLVTLVDQYCIAPYSPSMQLGASFLSMNVPWTLWWQEWQQTPANMAQWSLYNWRTWVLNYQQFLNATQGTPTTQTTVPTSPASSTTTTTTTVTSGRGLQATTTGTVGTTQTTVINPAAANAGSATTVTSPAQSGQTTTVINAPTSSPSTSSSPTTVTTVGQSPSSPNTVTTAANSSAPFVTIGPPSTLTTTTVTPTNATITTTPSITTSAPVVTPIVTTPIVQPITLWLPQYDSMSVAQVEADLTNRGIMTPFLDWYNRYWSSQGIAVVYFENIRSTTTNIQQGTTASQTPTSSTAVPQTNNEEVIVTTNKIPTTGFQQISSTSNPTTTTATSGSAAVPNTVTHTVVQPTQGTTTPVGSKSVVNGSPVSTGGTTVTTVSGQPINQGGTTVTTLGNQPINPALVVRSDLFTNLNVQTIPDKLLPIVQWIQTELLNLYESVNLPMNARLAYDLQQESQQQDMQRYSNQYQSQQTGQEVQPLFFPYEDYIIPLSCWHYPTVDRYDTYCCRNANNDDRACYALLMVNSFFANHMTQLCQQLVDIWKYCPDNDLTCGQYDLFNWFRSIGYALVYGQLYFDPLAQRSIFETCHYNGYDVKPINFNLFRHLWFFHFGHLYGP